MKTTEPGQRDHVGTIGGLGLHETSGRRVLPQIVAGSVIMVVGDVVLEDAFQMPFVQDDHLVRDWG